MTLFERHLLGMSQLRCGPNKTILKGIFQPLLDALKLMQKEFLVLYKSRDFYYIISPIMIFLIFFFFWYSSPYMFIWARFINSILFFFCLVGISVYINFIGGYYSGSKYSYLGAIRAVAQSISFEVSFFFLLLCYINLVLKYEFSIRNIIFICPLFYPWIISIVVELGRAPLDFIEGERELVSGYNVEYSGTLFIF